LLGKVLALAGLLLVLGSGGAAVHYSRELDRLRAVVVVNQTLAARNTEVEKKLSELRSKTAKVNATARSLRSDIAETNHYIAKGKKVTAQSAKLLKQWQSYQKQLEKTL
jgi:cell division protein FtsB